MKNEEILNEKDSTNLFRRNGKITNIRAIAILMVVFAHSIIIYKDSWTLYTSINKLPICNLFESWIQLIAMPLFFSLSGYLFHKSKNKYNFITLFKKKTRRLFIPFFIFAFFWMIPIRSLVNYIGYQGKAFFEIAINCIFLGNDNGHLWYLPCLFFCFLLTYCFEWLIKKIEISRWLKSFLLFLTSFLFSYFFFKIHNFLGENVVRSVAINWLWFNVGFISSEYNLDVILKKYRFVFLVLAVFFSIYTLVFEFPYKKITTILLILLFYTIIPNTTNGISEFISKNSFGIYLFHSPMVYITYSAIPNSSPFLVVFFNFFVFGGIAILLTLLIRKLKLYVIIGE